MRIDEDVFVKVYGIHWEAFIDNGMHTFCKANGTIADVLIVDNIYTPDKFRRCGYATRLIDKLSDYFQLEIFPFAIQKTECALGFWNNIQLKQIK